MGLVRVKRGQLVLVAATVIAIGLVPVLFAYLQLGYHPDVDDPGPDIEGAEAVAFLDRSVHNASAATAGDHGWNDRHRLIDDVRTAVEGDVETLETSRLEAGVVYEVAYNGTAATGWAAENCESSEGKRFGDCAAVDGIVVQERAGEAVLVAVAFDVRIVESDGEAELTVLLEVGG